MIVWVWWIPNMVCLGKFVWWCWSCCCWVVEGRGFGWRHMRERTEAFGWRVHVSGLLFGRSGWRRSGRGEGGGTGRRWIQRGVGPTLICPPPISSLLPPFQTRRVSTYDDIVIGAHKNRAPDITLVEWPVGEKLGGALGVMHR